MASVEGTIEEVTQHAEQLCAPGDAGGSQIGASDVHVAKGRLRSEGKPMVLWLSALSLD